MVFDLFVIIVRTIYEETSIIYLNSEDSKFYNT